MKVTTIKNTGSPNIYLPIEAQMKLNKKMAKIWCDWRKIAVV